MLIEIHDLPAQKLKSLHIDIDFLSDSNVSVTTSSEVQTRTSNIPETPKSASEIPDEMLNASF